METSDTVKIVLAVASPIVFFTLLFGMAITYRRFKARRFNASYFPKWPEPPLTNTAPCCSCQSTPPTHLYRPPFAAQPNPPSSHNKESLAQPHFSDKLIPIHRISTTPQQDTHQRVNSVVSTLLTNADPSSELLPYGGRKSSAVSFFAPSGNVRLPETNGVVGIGQRRPSILTDPQSGVLNLRRVSMGGKEDVVRIRAASLKRTSLLPHTPQIGTLSPAPRSPTSKPHKPTHMTLTSHSPIPSSPSNASGHQALTAISTIPLKSPDTPSSIQTSSAGIFEAWRGFPMKGSMEITYPKRRSGVILSPRHYPLPRTPGPGSPLPPTPRPAPFDLAPPMISPVSSTRTPISGRYASGTGMDSSRPVSEVSEFDVIGGMKKGKGKVTYLADLVREEETRPRLKVVGVDPPVIPVPAGLRDSIYLKRGDVGEVNEQHGTGALVIPGLTI